MTNGFVVVLSGIAHEIHFSDNFEDARGSFDYIFFLSETLRYSDKLATSCDFKSATICQDLSVEFYNTQQSVRKKLVLDRVLGMQIAVQFVHGIILGVRASAALVEAFDQISLQDMSCKVLILKDSSDEVGAVSDNDAVVTWAKAFGTLMKNKATVKG